MRFAFPTLLLCSGLVFAALENPGLPKGPAPRLVVAQVRDGNYAITSQVEVPVVQTIEVKVKEGDKTVVEKRQVTAFQSVPQERTMSGKSMKVYDTEGKLVPPADAAARLKEPTLVLLSGNAKIPDPAYLALLKEKTLILVSEFPASPPGVVPVQIAPPPPPPPPPGK
jgi:hypothetical protein